MTVRTATEQHLAECRACLLGARDRLARLRRLGSLNQNDRDMYANAIANFYCALDLVWAAQIAVKAA